MVYSHQGYQYSFLCMTKWERFVLVFAWIWCSTFPDTIFWDLPQNCGGWVGTVLLTFYVVGHQRGKSFNRGWVNAVLKKVCQSLVCGLQCDHDHQRERFKDMLQPRVPNVKHGVHQDKSKYVLWPGTSITTAIWAPIQYKDVILPV